MANAYSTNICIQGIWLITTGDRVKVMVRMADQDYTIIDEYAPLKETTISHSVSALGIQTAIDRIHAQWEDVTP